MLFGLFLISLFDIHDIIYNFRCFWPQSCRGHGLRHWSKVNEGNLMYCSSEYSAFRLFQLRSSSVRYHANQEPGKAASLSPPTSDRRNGTHCIIRKTLFRSWHLFIYLCTFPSSFPLILVNGLLFLLVKGPNRGMTRVASSTPCRQEANYGGKIAFDAWCCTSTFRTV